MNLGVNVDGNTWKLALINFGLFFAAQLVYGLIELLPLGVFPSPWQLYKMGIISLGTTLGFYGINKVTHKK